MSLSLCAGGGGGGVGSWELGGGWGGMSTEEEARFEQKKKSLFQQPLYRYNRYIYIYLITQSIIKVDHSFLSHPHPPNKERNNRFFFIVSSCTSRLLIYIDEYIYYSYKIISQRFGYPRWFCFVFSIFFGILLLFGLLLMCFAFALVVCVFFQLLYVCVCVFLSIFFFPL